MHPCCPPLAPSAQGLWHVCASPRSASSGPCSQDIVGTSQAPLVAVQATRAACSGRLVVDHSRTVATLLDVVATAHPQAVEYVESGMVLGLGTGSTAAFAVARIGQLLKEGKLENIVGVPTSTRTAEQAAALGIPLSVLDDHPKIDLAIDGADEVDPALNLMVEKASARFIVIVDETKLVDGLGGSGLAMPVEIVQFCWKYNLERLKNLPEVAGCTAKLRMSGDKPYVTDNSNYIVDLYFTRWAGGSGADEEGQGRRSERPL
eukprot:SM001185S25540  [mRNA]  locus=s1185:25:2174:+ [translate_table: standard]